MSSTKPTVLMIGGIRHCGSEWKALGAKYNLLEFPSEQAPGRGSFLDSCKRGDYDAVVGIYRSNASTQVTGPFDRSLVDALPASLRYIAHNGAGYDNVDVAACSDRRIAVSATPGAVDDSTADTGLFLMLGALRNAYPHIAAIKAGQWKGKGADLGHNPRGKTLGILGMGGIGRAMARRARAFGCDVVYHNRRRLDPALEEGARYLSFDELLAQSDIFSLSLSLNDQTRHIIGAAELARMKPGVVVVNTARGALIDEAALVEALESGHVAAVGLDVFENEPEVHRGLLRSDRAFIVPHIGTSTVEAQRDMELLTLANLEAAVDKGALLTLVPEQKGLDWAPPQAEAS